MNTTAAPTVQPEQASTGVVITGYLLAALIPFVGAIVGIVLMFKSRLGHGIAILVVSVIAFVIWFSILTSAATNNVNSQIDQIDQQSQQYTQCLDAATTLPDMNACDYLLK